MSLELQLGANVQPAVDALKQVSTGLKSMGEEVKRTDQTWQQFVGQRMGSYMQQFGSHGAAIKQIAEEWKAYKGNIEQAVPANEHIKASFAGETGIIQQLRAQLAGLKTSLQNATDPADIAKFSSAIVNTKNQLHDALAGSNAFATSTFGVSRATRLAHADLENVSQSIRGFATGSERGVDALSNIVFSFERLRGVSGGTGAAMRALGETLLGPAGIVLAITTLLPLAQVFIDKLFGLSEAQKKAAEDAKKLAEAHKAIIDSTAKEATQVTELVAVLQNNTESHERQLSAKKKLIEIAPEYFGNLDKEGTSLKTITGDYDKYIANLDRAIETKLRESELEKLIADRIEKTNKLQLLAPIIPAGKFGTPGLSEDQKKLQSELEITNQKIERLHKTIDENHQVKIDINSAGADKGLTEIQRKLIALAELAQEFFRVPLNLKFLVDDTDKEKLIKAQEIINGIKDKTIRLQVISPNEKELGTQIRIPKLQAEIDKEGFKKSIDTLLEQISIPLKVAVDNSSLRETEDKLQSIFADFADKSIFGDIGRRTGEQFREALLKSVEVLRGGFLITPQINTEVLIKSLTDSFGDIRGAASKIIKTEDFAQGLETLRELGSAGKAAGEATRKAFLDAGKSASDATKAGKAVQDAYGGISKQTLIAAQSVESVLTPAFQNFFDAITNKKNPIKAFFDSIIKSVEQLIQKFIAAKIQAAVLNSLSPGSNKPGASPISAGAAIPQLIPFAGQVAAKSPQIASEAAATTALTGLTTAAGGAATSQTAVAITGKIASTANSALAVAAFNAALALKLMALQASGGGGGPLGLIGTFLGFIPGFAEGGTPEVGQVAMVGERGPELFIPKIAGIIIPNHQVQNFSSSITKSSFSEVASTIRNNAIQNFIQSLPQLKTGGLTSSDTVAQLHKAEVIMPLDRLQGLIGKQNFDSSPQEVTFNTVLRGEDIWLSGERYTKRKGRSY